MPKRSVVHDLEAAPLLSLSAPKINPPKLAPPKYSAADQIAASDKPRTRIVKDVLSVGKWKVGVNPDGSPRFWDVTHDTLKSIARNFELAQTRGVQMNMVWGHGDPATKIVDPRNIIAPIDQVVVHGDRLWFTSYVTPKIKADLQNTGHRVSARVVEEWSDGRGRSYDHMLLHVGVVDNPVVDSQGSFVDMSNTHQLSNPETRMDFKRMLEQLNKLLSQFGLQMPESTTEENLNDTLDIILGTLDQLTGNTGEEAPASPGDSEAVPSEAMPEDAEMSLNAKGTIFGRLNDLANTVAQLVSSKAKEAYDAKLTELFKAGSLNGAMLKSLQANGAKSQYDLSLLVPFEGLKVIDMSNASKKHANGKAPTAPGVLSDEQIAEGIAALGGKPKTK